MEIILNTENSKTNEPHRFRLDLTDKLNLQNPKINMEINKQFKYLLHMEEHKNRIQQQ